MSFQLVLGLVFVVGAVPLLVVSGRRPTDDRTGAALRRGLVDTPARRNPATSSTPYGGALRTARKLTPAGAIDRLEGKLTRSGLLPRVSIEQVLLAKLGFLLGAALLLVPRATASPGLLTVLMAGVGMYGAWYLPEFVVSTRADARQLAIKHALPDTLDQLTIAVQAGLGFESALSRVVGQGHGPLNDELRRMLQDIQLGMARSEAFEAVAERTEVDEVRRFVNAARQAEKHGLPIVSVLRTHANELRERQRQAAEEHAMKIPVKVLFPLVLFILPTIFIVVLGPAVIRISETGVFGG